MMKAMKPMLTTAPRAANDSLTAVAGFRVGHSTDLDGITGCTVILCPENTVGGVDVRGGAPGTRETDLLRPDHLVQHVHAVVLSGGSAYGLAAADGAMRWLAERGVGFPLRGTDVVVPIVPAAILLDLTIGSADARPNADAGYAACEAASAAPVAQGNVGAGMGCRVSGLLGNARATKGGLGSAAFDLGEGLIVGALLAVNPFGAVLDERGDILAGLRDDGDGTTFASPLDTMLALGRANAASLSPATRENTVIGVVATNARLTKEGCNRVASMAHDGLARAIFPAHTLYDGDTIFALATGAHDLPVDPSIIGGYAALAVEAAIRAGVRAAATLGGARASND
jgi:L-aminopeptidase/D-esterase-like protein